MLDFFLNIFHIIFAYFNSNFYFILNILFFLKIRLFYYHFKFEWKYRKI